MKLLEKFPTVFLLGQLISVLLAFATGRSVDHLWQVFQHGQLVLVTLLAIFIAVVPTAIAMRMSGKMMLCLAASQIGSFFGVVYLATIYR